MMARRRPLKRLSLLISAAACVALGAAAAGEQPDAPGEPGTRPTLPDLTGTWFAAESPESEELSLHRHQPGGAAAAEPNSVYARLVGGQPRGHCSLTPAFSYATRQLVRIELQCDGAHGGAGRVVVAGAALELSINGTTWVRRSATPATHNATIHTVHMVYMNHYDVGYTGFVNDVDNKYMHDYFPLAAATAKQMKANASDGGDRFIYTTHAWLMQRFLECPCPQPPPTPPCKAGLPGVWTAADGRPRFFFSRMNEILSVRCLTADWTATPTASCTWETGTCSLSGSNVECELDNGETMAGAVSPGVDSIAYHGGAAWRKFTGNLSGLWYGDKRVVDGPSDPQDYYVIGHNATDGNVSVWWDTAITTPSATWTHSTAGALRGMQIELQLDGHSYASSGLLSGTVSPEYASIQFNSSNDEAGLWHPHAAQCYPGSPACPSKCSSNPTHY